MNDQRVASHAPNLDQPSHGPNTGNEEGRRGENIDVEYQPPATETPTPRWKLYLRVFEKQLIAYNFEERGIRRVEPSERHDLRTLGFTQIFVLWWSINLAANNITLGMLGPAVFSLSFLDASLCAVFGMLVGCLPVAYTATFGPRSGNRTMIFARYTMGWWPSKLVVVLNIIVLLGYSLIDCVVAGQILSAVSPGGSLSVVVGIVIVAVVTWVITTFGYSYFHYYERNRPGSRSWSHSAYSPA